MHELPPTGVRVSCRVGISFKLGVIVLPKLPLSHRRMRLFVYYLGLFVYYLGFRSLSLFPLYELQILQVIINILFFLSRSKDFV